MAFSSGKFQTGDEENVNIGTGWLAYNDYLSYVGQSIERESCLVIRSSDDWFDCHELWYWFGWCKVEDFTQILQKNDTDWKGRSLQRNKFTSQFERRK